MKGTDDEGQKWFSREFLQLGREITEVSERAGEAIQGKLEAMYGAMGKKLRRFKLDEAALARGAWACESHCCRDEVIRRDVSLI